MKLSKNREKYLLEKYFNTKKNKNLPTHISQLGCRDCDTSDEDLFFITQYVSKIDRLSIGGSFVTKEGLEYLKKLIRVEYLDLKGVPINDDNLDCILHLKDVNYLYIKHTDISIKGIYTLLRVFSNLETLIADIDYQDEELLKLWRKEFPNCDF